MRDILNNAFTSEGFSLTDVQNQQFVDYFDMLIEWNQKINLTAIEEPTEVAYKHFVDSACLMRVVPDLEGKSGTVKLENYTKDSKNVIFKPDK